MTLYEIVLRRPERDDEVRFTDHEPEPGTLLKIDCRAWKVGQSEPSPHHIARTRFVCVIDDNEQ
jgi:hypothetical protein